VSSNNGDAAADRNILRRRWVEGGAGGEGVKLSELAQTRFRCGTRQRFVPKLVKKTHYIFFFSHEYSYLRVVYLVLQLTPQRSKMKGTKRQREQKKNQETNFFFYFIIFLFFFFGLILSRMREYLY